MNFLHHFRRLFLPIPDAQGREVVWIHAVSVGEAKAVKELFRLLRNSYPGMFFLATTATATGLDEARRSLSGADAFSYLPLDFGWIVRRWVRKLHPKLFLLVETDFWPNLLSALKLYGAKTALVNGKLSERSASRFLFFRFFSKKLFQRFDLLCVQNEEHRTRFLPFVEPSRLHIAGNLKFDHRPESIDVSLWRGRLILPDPAIVISCTHAPEEELLLNTLPLEDFFLCLAPRHPQRFEEVAELLRSRSIPFFRWTHFEERRGGERVLLIDAMGQLPILYSLSRLAILGGSFTPKIGGHNILEPCLYGTPVLFGPYMFSQTELSTRILKAQAGIQAPISSLATIIRRFFDDPMLEANMRSAARSLAASGQNATACVFQMMQALLENRKRIWK